MVIVGLLSWWYTGGLKSRIASLYDRIDGVYDYFSIGLLFKTLFAPFRQISAGRVDGPIGVQLRAFLDRLISRIIGSIVRSGMILFGCVSLAVVAIVSIIILAAWLVMPVLPIIGFILMTTGWVPWHL